MLVFNAENIWQYMKKRYIAYDMGIERKVVFTVTKI